MVQLETAKNAGGDQQRFGGGVVTEAMQGVGADWWNNIDKGAEKDWFAYLEDLQYPAGQGGEGPDQQQPGVATPRHEPRRQSH